MADFAQIGSKYEEADDEVDLLVQQIERRRAQLINRMQADINLKKKVDMSLRQLKLQLSQAEKRMARRAHASAVYGEVIVETQEAFQNVIRTADVVADILNADAGADGDWDPTKGRADKKNRGTDVHTAQLQRRSSRVATDEDDADMKAAAKADKDEADAKEAAKKAEEKAKKKAEKAAQKAASTASSSSDGGEKKKKKSSKDKKEKKDKKKKSK